MGRASSPAALAAAPARTPSPANPAPPHHHSRGNVPPWQLLAGQAGGGVGCREMRPTANPPLGAGAVKGTPAPKSEVFTPLTQKRRERVSFMLTEPLLVIPYTEKHIVSWETLL